MERFLPHVLPRSYFIPRCLKVFEDVVAAKAEDNSLEFLVMAEDELVKVRFSAGRRWVRVTAAPHHGPATRGAVDDVYELVIGDYKLKAQTRPFRWALFKGGELLLKELNYGGEEPVFHGTRRWLSGVGYAEDGRRLWVLTLALEYDDHLYGLGETFGPLDKRGTEFICYSADPPRTPNLVTYIPIPFLWSVRGWGILLNTPAPSYWDVGYFSYGVLAVVVRDDLLDYYIIFGENPKELLKAYYELTGWPSLPPRWSFGFWISRCAYRSQDEVLRVAREFRRRGIPCDVIHIDPPWQDVWRRGLPDCINLEWDREAFPDPQGMIEELRRLGFRLCLWINPYLDPTSRLYFEALRGGYLLKDERGWLASPDQEPQRRVGCGLFDLTNPEAFRFFKESLKRLLRQGVSVLKSDYGEAAPRRAVYHGGEHGERLHNLYPLLYQRAVYEAVKEVHGEGLVWGRSGYAGIQRYPVQWGGDTTSTWQDLYTALRGVLNFACSGAVFASFDIGGFVGRPSPKLYVRWLQMGLFVSHCRAHGTTPREPWEYGEEAERIARKLIRLRYRLLPYIYSEAVRAVREGVPLVRPLVVEHPDDPTTYHLDTEYYFGSFMLVAPILSERDERLVYLPKGRWYDFWEDLPTDGGRWHRVRAPLDRIPLFIKAPALIPMLGRDIRFIDESPWDPLELHVWAAEGRWELAYDYHDAELSGIIRVSSDGRKVRVHIPPGLREAGISMVVVLHCAGSVSRRPIPAGEELVVLELPEPAAGCADP